MAAASRLKLKQTPTDIWSTREKLCLASSVMRSGDQNWVSVSRAIKPFAEPARPQDWFSQKNCALQYSDLLEKVETPKRKRGDRSETETPGESIVRKLSIERIEELKKFMQQQQQIHRKLKSEIESIRSGQVDDKLHEIWNECLEEKKKEDQAEAEHQIWLEEREAAKQVALAAMRTGKPIISPQKTTREIQKKLSSPVKSSRPILMRRESSQSEPGSEPESVPDSPISEPINVDSVVEESATPEVPTTCQITPVTSTPKPSSSTTPLHVTPPPTSPLLTSLLKSPSSATAQASFLLHSAASTPQKESWSSSSTMSSTISSLLQTSPTKPGLHPSFALTVDTETLARIPSSSPSAGAPTLSRLLEMPLVSPGKPLPPLPVVEVENTLNLLKPECIAPPSMPVKEEPAESQAENQAVVAEETEQLQQQVEVQMDVDALISSDEMVVEIGALEEVTHFSGELGEQTVEVSTVTDVVAQEEVVTTKEFEPVPEEVTVKLEVPEETVLEPSVVAETPVIEVAANPDVGDAVEEVTAKVEAKVEPDVDPVNIAATATKEPPSQPESVATNVSVSHKEDGVDTKPKLEPSCAKDSPATSTGAVDAEPTAQESIQKKQPNVEKSPKKISAKEQARERHSSSSSISSSCTSSSSASPSTLPITQRGRGRRGRSSRGRGWAIMRGTKPTDEEQEDSSRQTDQDEDMTTSDKKHESTVADKSKDGTEAPIKKADEEAAAEFAGRTKKATSNDAEKKKGQPTKGQAVGGRAGRGRPRKRVEAEEEEDADDDEDESEFDSDDELKDDRRCLKPREQQSGSEFDDDDSNLVKLGSRLSQMDSIPNSPASTAQSDDQENLRDYKVWKKAIMLVWRSAATHKFANVFLHPVTEEVAPGYHSVVHRPMDLILIKKNIENGGTKTTVEFQRDMMLMFQNAIMYNNSDHDVFNMAVEMQKEVMRHIQDFLATQLMVQTTEAMPKSLRRETRELVSQKRTSECLSDKQSEDSKRGGSTESESKPKKRRTKGGED